MPEKKNCKEELGRHAPIAIKRAPWKKFAGSLKFLVCLKPYGDNSKRTLDNAVL